MIRYKAMPDDKPAAKPAAKPAKAPAKAKAAPAPKKDLLDLTPDDADDKD